LDAGSFGWPEQFIHMEKAPDFIYAIGDVHGCIRPLRLLHELIMADWAKTEAPALIVMLGDYIDRGPSSADVLQFLSEPLPPGLQRICLLGNHERLMLDVIDRKCALSDWLWIGGKQTLRSYGIDIDYLRNELGLSLTDIQQRIATALPVHHLDLLRRMPLMISTPSHVFVHAGIRPGVALSRQKDHDLLLIRDDFLQSNRPHADKIVVHGHTQQGKVLSQGRISLDTGVHLGGRLTSARISPMGIKLASVSAG
jgi:serine/threonine protein phosphatase 1